MGTRPLCSVDVYLARAAIPVKVFPATREPPAIAMNLLHRGSEAKPCHARLRQLYVCSADNAIVEPEERVKGFEVAKDRYVVFSSEELELLETPSEPGVHVEEFLDVERIDPIYFAKAFYLGPDKGGEKGYRLLMEVMQRMGKVALGRYAQRGKQRLVVLRPAPDLLGGRIVLQQLLHAEEVRPPEEEIPAPALKPEEIRLASEFVARSSVAAFEPGRFPDEQRARTLELIRDKAEGREIVAPKSVGGRKQYLEIADALRDSLEGEKKRAAR